MIEFISQLPIEYQEVEYLRSDGGQHIELDYIPNQNTKVKIDFMATNTDCAIFGSRIDYNNAAFTLYWSKTNAAAIEIGSSMYSLGSLADSNRHLVEMSNTAFIMDGSTVHTYSTGNFKPNAKFRLFHSGGADSLAKMQGDIYSCEISEGDNLMCCLVACCRKADNEAGVYDIVNKVFYTNAGSGVFTVGANSNKHTIATITPGGIIPMQYALRRMMMAALGSGIDVAALSITYTGAHTDYGMVTMSDGARYRLLAFTSSGTLSIEQPVKCEVCVVGGGANGLSGASGGVNTCAGGAGAYMKNQVIEAFDGGEVIVGAAQGASSIGGVSVNAVSGKSGGTGGGGAYINSGGTGDGLSKYPFGDLNYELWSGKPHCAGGGGGGYDNDGQHGGGRGGSNGTNGDGFVSGTPYQGAGGLYGGGNGGPSQWNLDHSGVSGSYYGSAGGGGGRYNNSKGNGGSGYQGIVYMRIPEEPAA